ncbi:aspartyl/glutamyl-tRNA amidotransferase subunit B [bacterium J17]|nr:aspartyl/glutamyl-tRNA amidotransferase subunit B [bacterium J17]
MGQYEAVIGLEVHAQLSTESKIFACSSAASSGKEPNTLTDPVVLGLPGCLPVLNKRVVDYAIKLGLATNCTIEKESVFARKHYFYPDLPKGYQISQFEKPICSNGKLEIRIEGDKKTIGITRIHLEEDAGKNTHLEKEPKSIVDLNRAGVPLVEIVSEPDIRTAKEAGAYMRLLRQIVRYLNICDGNMEEGSLRCDANVSIRKVGETELGTKVEVKNLNSFRFVEKAIDYEISRQISTAQQGSEIVQETRLWDETSSSTKTMRGKEHAEDYRYFPDPDLPPLLVDEDWIEDIRETLPELPSEAFERFVSMYALDENLAELLTDEREVARYYDSALAYHHNPTLIANWVSTELFGRLNKEGVQFENCPISPENLASLVKLIDDEVISGKIAKTVFEEMFTSGNSAENIVEAKGLRQITDTSYIEAVINRIIEANPGQVEEFRAGKTKVLGFFVGQTMKETQGKANPKLVNEILQAKLKG